LRLQPWDGGAGQERVRVAGERNSVARYAAPEPEAGGLHAGHVAKDGIFAPAFCVKTVSMLPPDAQYEDSAVAEAESREKVEEPPLFKVLLHNDDFTTMEFVVWVLESIYNMPEEQAIQVMLNVHLRGTGVAGIYTYEVAETKVEKTTALAREHEYPLLATMEEV
jgi:ATP-dependent Clp protease adaptor protein ClpS